MGREKIRLQQLALDLATAPGFGNCAGFRNCPWLWQLADLETDMDSATVAMASFGNCCCGFGNRTGFRIWGLRQLATAYQPPASQPLEAPGPQAHSLPDLRGLGLGLGTWALQGPRLRALRWKPHR